MRNARFDALLISVTLAATLVSGCEGGTTAPSPTYTPPVYTPPAATSDDQIVYAGIRGDPLAPLTLVNADGSGLIRLEVGLGAMDPDWSPDGRKLVYSKTMCDTDWETYYVCENGGLEIMDVDSRQVTVPTSGSLGEDPVWSPTGDMIAFVRWMKDSGQRHLFVMSPDGSTSNELTIPGVSEVRGPAWSPDGSKILFVCSEAICVVNRDGSGFTHLSNGIQAVEPAWSPDGKRIAFLLQTFGRHRVSLMGADGSNVTSLADGFSPSWSRDGTRLAFLRDGVAGGLFTINADGSGEIRLAAGIINAPAWRPKR